MFGFEKFTGYKLHLFYSSVQAIFGFSTYTGLIQELFNFLGFTTYNLNFGKTHSLRGIFGYKQHTLPI